VKPKEQQKPTPTLYRPPQEKMQVRKPDVYENEMNYYQPK